MSEFFKVYSESNTIMVNGWGYDGDIEFSTRDKLIKAIELMVEELNTKLKELKNDS